MWQRLAFVTVSLVFLGAPAFAHSQIIGSNPKNGAHLDALPSTVEVKFNEELKEPAFIAVVAPNGDVLKTETTIEGNVARASVESSEQTGEFALNYRVVSADGHPITGSVTFSVEGASPTALPSPSAISDQPVTEVGMGIGWLILVIAAIIAVVVSGLALWRIQRRDTRNDGP